MRRIISLITAILMISVAFPFVGMGLMQERNSFDPGNTNVATSRSSSSIVLPDIDFDPEVILGDVNNDGSINSSDYAVLLRFFSGANITIDPETSDINKDGQVINTDLSLLSRILSGAVIN